MAGSSFNRNWLILVLLVAPKCFWAQLSATFDYSECPNVTMQSLLRLHFDCFVNGCDGSILFTGEQTAAPNNGSVRGYYVINDTLHDGIEAAISEKDASIVGGFDIVPQKTALSWEVKRDSNFTGVGRRDSKTASFNADSGPTWQVLLGRRDRLTANRSGVDSDIPTPFESLDVMRPQFTNKGMDITDLVALSLSGSHTIDIGDARCVSFSDRIYNETNIDPTSFDNNSYNNLIEQKGLLHSDQVLFNGGSTDSLVRSYSQSPKRRFAADFAAAMVKMGDIGSDTIAIVNRYASSQSQFFDNTTSSMIKLGSIGVLKPLTGAAEIRVSN
uniref:Peroxidase n=1 Tax=Gossypium hirsutum TaxID=3635 RepID=Q9FPP5_GOSHI|nr:peroxidase isozyme [Gossypium hirsutum]